MKKKDNTSARASALQIALAISLLSICSILLAASFANPLAGRHGLRSMARPAITCTVTSTADSGPGTLRDCLAGTADTIDATGVSGTILLTSAELQITHDVTINGPGSANLAVNGNAAFRVFENFASSVTLSGLTITNGLADGNGGGGIFNHGGLILGNCVVSDSSAFIGNNQGGGIRNNSGAMLSLSDSIISGNSAVGGGSGIHSSNAELTVTNSTITGNIGGGQGGGIFYNGGGTLTVTNSIISGNSAGDGGGMGSDLQGTTIATVSDSTISGNSAGRGGGIFNYPQTLTVISSTVSGNSASDGGGIWNGGNPGSVTVINSTISGNSATASGGGISNYAQNNGLTLKNSTLSGNSAPAGNGSAIFNQGGSTTTIGDTVLNAGASGGTLFNNGGTVTSLGYNLASDTGGGVLTGPGDQINTDPMLGPLQDNGGPTFTHELLPGSPANDMGDPSFTPPPDYDQRGPGFPRVVDGRIDIGSFEVQPPAAPTNLTATVTACQEITLHWTDNSNNETGFKIERSNNGVNFSQIARVPANTTMYVNHLATSGLRYYRVRAYIHVSGGDYNSGYSNIDSATADPCPTPSPTPTATFTPTPTPTVSPSATPTATATPTPTATATTTATATPTATATATATSTATPTATATPRPTPTPRIAPTPRPRPTPPARP